MIFIEKILEVLVEGTSVENPWDGLFCGVPTVKQLTEAMRIDIEALRERFDSDPKGEQPLDSVIGDWFALLTVVEHGDTLNAGPVRIAKCEIGRITYSPVNIFKEDADDEG